MTWLLVIGDVMVDVVVSHEGPVAPGSDTPARIAMRGGGSGANTACWLASTGRGVMLGASLGNDVVGRQAVDDLHAAGLSTALVIHRDRPTGTCVVLVDGTGERTMFPDRGANDAPEHSIADALHDDPDPEVDEPPPSWFHLSGYTLLGEGSRVVALDAIDTARRIGVPTSVDAASTAPLLAVGADVFLGWIDGIDVLFANEDEVEALGGPEHVLDHVGALVTKRGAAGASWTDGTATHEVPAVPAEVVDTTGAGDAFAAGYLDAWLAGPDPAAALAAGCALAAVAVTVVGGRAPR